MWISLIYNLVVLSMVKVVVGITRQPCCTGIFPRSNNYAHHWQKGLQEAVYHSLTQHSAFDGSLDERVERDRRLWKRVIASGFSDDLSIVNGVQTGVLINKEYYLEFRPSNYNCRHRECDKQILAVWEIQRTDHPKGYHITIKLPVSQSYIEDSYEYTSHHGLKHLGVENKHTPSTFKYNAGSDDKHHLKSDHRQIHKPIKFPTWNKHKNIYEINKKGFNNGNDRNEDDSEDYESDDRIIKIEPRRRFQNRNTLKPKHGLVLAFVPPNSQREFQILDQKYDGFVPISQEALRQQNSYNNYRHTSEEDRYNERNVKIYRDVIRKYINERNRPRPPSDFHPSKPYIQYSEPDPLYVEPSYTLQSEEKPNIDENKFLVLQQFPSTLNSQLPASGIVRVVPTVPYISVTVSNKIPVQNFNQIDLSTTPKPIETPVTTMREIDTFSLSSTKNVTNNDVELIPLVNNSLTTTRQPPTTFVTTQSMETSKEELTSTTTIQTTSIPKDLYNSREEIKSVMIKNLNRNIIKKDINTNNMKYQTRNSSNVMSDNTSDMSNRILVTTEIPSNDVAMNSQSDNTKNISNKYEAIVENQTGLAVDTEITTTIAIIHENSTQNEENIVATMTTPTIINKNSNTAKNKTSHETDKQEIISIQATTSRTENEKQHRTQEETSTETTTYATTLITETTTAPYFDGPKNQLADLFASLTHDFFNDIPPPPPFIFETSNEETPDYSQIFQQNSTETNDYTNYDEYLSFGTTEIPTQNRRISTEYTLVPLNNSSNRNISKIFSFKQHSNSH